VLSPRDWLENKLKLHQQYQRQETWNETHDARNPDRNGAKQYKKHVQQMKFQVQLTLGYYLKT